MRDHRIDLLRSVGLAMIILAHVGAPELLFQLRNFDVPLMILVAGLSFYLSFRPTTPYPKYLWKRIKRLVLPVWVFLTFYFSVQLLFFPGSTEISLRKIVYSYALISGIGYVWIIKVFILVAIAAPFLYQFNNRVSSNKLYFLILASLLISYEIFRAITLPHITSGYGRKISLVTHYIVPYSIIFAAGLRLMKLDMRAALNLASCNAAVFIIIAIALFLHSGEFVPTQRFKYPPSAYYLCYALAVAFFLWAHSEALVLSVQRAGAERVMTFVARNSIWIYLWHIPFLQVFQAHFAIKYPAVLICAVSVTFIQVWLVETCIPSLFSDRAKRNIKTIFTG